MPETSTSEISVQNSNNSSPSSTSYQSSPAAEGDLPPTDLSDMAPVYFFHDPATAHFSQWYLLDFRAPLPTKETILAGSKYLDVGTEESNTHSNDSSTRQWHTFDCNEQYMMYCKAVLFDDDETAAEVLLTKKNPRKCKAHGRRVRGFDSAVWDRYRESAVEEGNWWKFTNGDGKDGKRVRSLLLETGDREIVEASPFDRIWGIGFRANVAQQNRTRWGLNLLGKAIARVRTNIRAQKGE